MSTHLRGGGDPRGSLAERGGVTLIEVMISIVLASTLLLVSLNASANLLRINRQQRNTNHSAELAAQILDEVSSMDFRDRIAPVFGVEADENASDRSTFDDVDDFNGYTSTPPTHRDGTVISGYEDWSFSVVVTPADPDPTGITTTASDENSPLRIIRVLCTTADGTTVDGSALVSDVPSNITSTTSYEKWRRIKLTFPQREINVTAPLRNNPDVL